jgi:hypothetical protein
MLRGRVTRQRGGRRRVLSAINAKTAQLYGPYVRLGPLAYVTGHKPRGRGGSPHERGAYNKVWTRVGTGPLPVLGSSPSRNFAEARTSLGGGGGWEPPEGPDMSPRELRTRTHRGPVFLCGGLDPMVLPGMYYPSSPRGTFRPVHVAGSGATLRATWRHRTGAAPSYYRRWYS